MRKQQLILVSMLIGTAVMVQGCIIAAVGAGAAGTIAYVKGDLESVQSYNIDTVYQATLDAMNDLDLPVLSKTKDALTAEVVARDAQDKKVTIKLKAATEETTKLSIRIGTFGDKTKSQLIYDKIRENLPE
jgi:hypothetical protein